MQIQHSLKQYAAGPMLPRLRRMGVFICEQCGHEVSERNDRGRVKEPSKCPNDACKARFSMRLHHNRCLFSNKQIIKMQVRAVPGLLTA